jgi:hypothetical protein
MKYLKIAFWATGKFCLLKNEKRSYSLALQIDCSIVFIQYQLTNRQIAQDLEQLKSLGITHVLNASKGEKMGQINTNQQFYNSLNIRFIGFNIMDVDNCKIEKYFDDATDFIAECIDKNKGKQNDLILFLNKFK